MAPHPRVSTATSMVVAGPGGMFATDAGHLLALASVVLAVALAIIVATIMLLVRRRAARRRGAARAPTVGSPLSRLDYLPAVTSRAPRLRWRGSRYWFIGRIDPLPQADVRELIGRAAPPLRRTAADAATAGSADGGDDGAAAAG